MNGRVRSPESSSGCGDPLSLRALPFVAIDDATGEADLWNVKESGYSDIDNRAGEAMAADCLDYIRSADLPPFLGWVVAAMIRKGRFGPVECGFLHGISVCSMIGAPIAGAMQKIARMSQA